jgi:beta-galactosidase
MNQSYPPVNPRLPGLWHGGDYNPDQWLGRPDVLDEDFRLFPLARFKVASIGIFSWARLEPEEGRYDFSWLDALMDRLAAAGMKAVLATPTGAKPGWMAAKYPEVRRVNEARVRELQGNRHNHCYTSPVYRAKAVEINARLAERYKDHPALVLWHVSNEYGGECHCPLCQEAFRSWLEKRYGSLEALNAAWWTDFWSHRYSDWRERSTRLGGPISGATAIPTGGRSNRPRPTARPRSRASPSTGGASSTISPATSSSPSRRPCGPSRPASRSP